MPALAVANDLELRLVSTAAELAAAQELRYRVFFEELGAVADPATRRSRRDEDRFDRHADHLVVVDRARPAGRRGRPAVVGCYRLLRGSVARRAGGFYTESEYDLSGLAPGRGELLELGRSCVAPERRDGAVVQLLWRGIAAYLERHDVNVAFGCASLPGTDIAAVAAPVRYLHERRLAPLGLRPVARSQRRVAHEPFAAEGYDPGAAFRALPPLLKGYLRVGAWVGEGAVADEAFNTIDVCVVLPAGRIAERYRRHYAPAGADRLALAA